MHKHQLSASFYRALEFLEYGISLRGLLSMYEIIAVLRAFDEDDIQGSYVTFKINLCELRCRHSIEVMFVAFEAHFYGPLKA